MSPPAHLMLRGLPQRAASLELAWHIALRQRDIQAAECLHPPQCCQPARANVVAKPPAHVLALSQPHHDPQPGWPDLQANASEGRRDRLQPAACQWDSKRVGNVQKTLQEARGHGALSMTAIGSPALQGTCDWALRSALLLVLSPRSPAGYTSTLLHFWVNRFLPTTHG